MRPVGLLDGDAGDDDDGAAFVTDHLEEKLFWVWNGLAYYWLLSIVAVQDIRLIEEREPISQITISW